MGKRKKKRKSKKKRARIFKIVMIILAAIGSLLTGIGTIIQALK